MAADIGEIPEGWFVMHCNTCGTSLLWVKDDFDSDVRLPWAEILDWSIANVDHDMVEHALDDKLKERNNGQTAT